MSEQQQHRYRGRRPPPPCVKSLHAGEHRGSCLLPGLYPATNRVPDKKKAALKERPEV